MRSRNAITRQRLMRRRRLRTGNERRLRNELKKALSGARNYSGKWRGVLAAPRKAKRISNGLSMRKCAFYLANPSGEILHVAREMLLLTNELAVTTQRILRSRSNRSWPSIPSLTARRAHWRTPNSRHLPNLQHRQILVLWRTSKHRSRHKMT